MKDNLNAYYFILQKLFNDDPRLKIILNENAYDKDLIVKANNIALGHENIKGDISLQALKMPFYMVEKYKNNKAYVPQSLSQNFPEKTFEDTNIKFDQLSKKQFDLFLEELEKNKQYKNSHDDSFNKSVIWQETVETIALKHLSFIGIKTDTKNIHPVSLFDHMRLTASIYNVLENQENKEKPYLYIQGDFFGIQKFIFSDVNKTEQNAAKILRGRSAFVSILCELSAIKIINALKLPASARILTTAGKFNILAPNTQKNKTKLESLSKEIDGWFKCEIYSIAGMGIAFNELSADDIQGSNFNDTLKKLFDTLSEKKYSRLNLLNQDDHEQYIHTGYLEKFLPNNKNEDGLNPCDFIPYLSAKVKNDDYNDGLVSELADIQINIGAKIPTSKYLVICNKNVNNSINTKGNNLDVLGYQINIVNTNQLNNYNDDEIVRIYDIDDKTDNQKNRTYGKKFISAHTPKDLTFDEIAKTNITQDKNGNNIGVPALASLKGDIDNLGNIFQDKETLTTLARTLYRSRMLDLYFSYRLSYLCKNEYESIYVVFAGGDDFFLLGGSSKIIQFVNVFKEDFKLFTQNPNVHFSCGLGVFKSNHPVNYISNATEKYLENAKEYKNPESFLNNLADKNAICCYGQTVSLDNWDVLMGISDDFEHHKGLLVSTSAMYKWIRFSEMSENKEKDRTNAIWRSHFTYQAVRLKENKQLDQDYLIGTVIPNIQNHKEAFKIPLFTYLYNNRQYLGDK